MNTALTSLAVALLAATTVGSDGTAARDRPRFTAHQISQVRTIGQVAIAPDGRQLVYGLSGYYFEFPVIPRFGEDNNLRLLSLETGEIRVATSGPAPKTAPAFSPSSDRVAYESEDDIWVVRLSDGSVTRVTSNAARDTAPCWAPDGKRLVFVSSRGGRTDLWVTSVEGEQHGLTRLTDDPLSEQDPQWSPDGSAVAYTANRSDEWYSQGVFTVPATGGPPRRLTPADRFDYSTARWSPDSRTLAFISDRTGYLHVWVMGADGSGAREFETGPHDVAGAYWTVQPVWSRDGREILMSMNREGSYDLLRLSVADGRIETIESGGGQYHEVGWAQNGDIVYGFENAWSPPDLYARPPGGRPARQLTHSSHVAFRREHFATMRRVSFPSTDGLELHGFLLTPGQTAPARRLPAVVALHPNGYGQFTDHWSPLFHYLAQSGYVVLLVDQRGSSGYGRKFREAQIGSWGTGTLEDVKAAAGYVRAQTFVDGARVGVMGLSFGGYNTLLALTKTPRLFQAGIDLMGPTDRRGSFTDAYRAFQIGATEKDNPQLYDRISPITSVEALEAPLLILHSDRDRNVAPENTYRFVDALERHGKPYDLRIYPGEGHGLADPAHQVDSYERIVAFFDRYLTR